MRDFTVILVLIKLTEMYMENSCWMATHNTSNYQTALKSVASKLMMDKVTWQGQGPIRWRTMIWPQVKFLYFTYRLVQEKKVVFHEILPSWIAEEIPTFRCKYQITTQTQYLGTQAPQAANRWCMRQLVYIENCMGKSPIVKKLCK